MKAQRATVKSLVSLKAWMLLCLVMLCAAGVKAQTPYAIWCADNATFYFVNSERPYCAGGVYDGTNITMVWSGEQVTENAGWMEDASHNEDMGLHNDCQKIVFDESFKDVRPSNLSQWFYYFLKVTSIEGMAYLNTSEATKMDWMFGGCSELTTIDVSNFDTSKVTDMNGMFKDCYGLTNILGLENLNTSNVTDMSEMFLSCSGLTTVDVRSFDTSMVTDMHNMFLSCSNLTNISGMENLNTSNVTNMRNMFYKCSALTVLDLSSFDVSKVKYMNQMFDGCTSLKTIYSKNDWNSQYSGTTSTAYMFNDCTSLIGGNGTRYSSAYTNGIYANLDVESKPGYFTSVVDETPTPYVLFCEETKTLHFINSNTRYFEGRLYDGVPVTNVWSGTGVTNCISLPGWYTVNGKYTKAIFDESFLAVKPQKVWGWFYNAPYLTTIEGLEYLDTSEATTMREMFVGCSSLTSLDISHFDTRNVKNMSSMFRDCSGLKSITGLDQLNTSNVTNMGSMFSGCSSLTSLDLRNFEINLTLEAQPEYSMFNSMFYGCSSLTTIYCNTDWNEKITVYNQQASGINDLIGASMMFEGCTSLVGGKGTTYDETKIHNDYARPDLSGLPGYFTSEIMPYAIWCADNATFYFVNSERAYWAGGVYDGKTITKVWSGEQVTENAGWMEDASHNEDMGLHNDCQKIVFDESFKDVRPSNLSQWFYYFLKVTSIEGMAYLNTSEATKMDWMFGGCSELTTIDVSNFDTSKVTDMNGMFKDCYGLTNILGLENLNTSNVTDMSEMFLSCSGLTTVDVRSFDTSMVTDMHNMFLSCSNLTNISGMENLNTSNVTNMRNMFYKCSALTVLDLSSFDVSKVKYMNQMFDGCTSLKTIYSKNDWNSQYSGTTSTAYMFNDCTSLIGGNGTRYSSAYTNGIYANLDVESKPGYFTSVVDETPTPYVLFCEETKTLHFINSNTRYFEGRLYDGVPVTNVWSGTGVTNCISLPGWYTVNGKYTKAIFDESFLAVKPQKVWGWFYNAPYLTTIEGLEYLDTSEATTMREMFVGCSSLTSLDISHFDTRNVKNMSSMFRDCSGLKSITGLDQLNTSNVTNMGSMFSGCSSLTSLDLRNFEINLTLEAQPEYSMFNSMFYGCSSLTTIYCNTDWNEKITVYNQQASGINDLIGASMMFEGCTSLVGGKGTTYDETKIHNEYARPDRDGIPGYFTRDVKTYDFTITKAMVGTLYLPYPVTIPENEDYFNVYYVKSIDAEGIMRLKEIHDIIPANTATIIFGNTGTYTMSEADSEGGSITDNLLYGVTEATSVADLQAQHGTDIYVLSRGQDSYIGFRLAGGSVKTIPANRAYLPYTSSNSAQELSISFEDEEATGISDIAGRANSGETKIYNLSGQRVTNPQHGIYIVNGKKVYIR